DDEMQQVDAFLLCHPDLQAEFEILGSTKLPAEEFSFNKEDLFAESMKVNAIDEDLLLYIDNELPAEKAKIMALELDANKDYQPQHQLLMKAKLDPSEKIIFPNKEILYQRTERRIFQPWMRIAAAAVVIAAMGVIYFNRPGSSVTPAAVAKVETKKPVQENKPEPKKDDKEIKEQESPVHSPGLEQNIAGHQTINKRQDVQVLETLQQPVQQQDNNNLVAINRDKMKPLETLNPNQATDVTGKFDVSMENAVLNNAVTISSPEPLYNTNADNQIASNRENKGSVKGFLRKATRLIEKRTGIDATTDGELLIGVLAIKLK
ncbi:MAG: hypothetical protein ACXWV0_06990, partial [Flavisolibacter sp.]